jgi:protein SCO1/2
MRYAPVLVACLLAGLVAFPWLSGLVSDEAPSMTNAQVGGHFSLPSAEGTFASSDLDKELMLIYFGYTYCPDVCPTELARMAAVVDGLEADADRVQGLFVTVDPERDTVDLVTQYARAFDDTFIGLSGSEAQIQPVMSQYQVYAAKVGDDPTDYLVDHSSRIYVMNRDAELLALFSMDTPVTDMIAQVRRFL